MKKFILSCLLITAINSYSQWILQYDNTNISLYDMQFTSINTGFIVGAQNSTQYFLKTTNSGNNWSVSSIPYIASYQARLSFINDYTGWVCGLYDQTFGMVLKTTNQGQSWDSISVTVISGLIDIQFININTGWTLARSIVHTGHSVYKTTNSGQNWFLQLTVNGGNFNLHNQHFVNSNVGYITGFDTTTKNSFIYKTINGGLNWNKINVGGDFICDNLFFVNENTGYTVSGIGYISKTTNGGYNWIALTVPDWHNMHSSVFFLNESTGYIVGYKFSKSNSLIKKTINGGLNWIEQTNGSNVNLHSVLFINSLTGWTVGDGKIFKTTNGGSTYINHISNELPSTFFLYQNYPNPFNPTTNIQFLISNVQFVNLKIFNILGKEVETLVNEKLTPGTYEATFNASKYPSGVYFYCINAGTYSETKKMLLIK
ncbi:MAG: YCF48-related protein [Ignavibacteria bacterium]|jgi:photosystem II stability/assembly factor-like uncharacterized protein